MILRRQGRRCNTKAILLAKGLTFGGSSFESVNYNIGSKRGIYSIVSVNFLSIRIVRKAGDKGAD